MPKSAAEEKLLKILEKSQDDQKSISKKLAKKKSFNIGLSAIVPLLVLSVIASASFLFYSIYQGMNLLKTEVTVRAENQFSDSQIELNIPSAKSVEFYLSQFDRRDIFVPYKEEVVTPMTEAEEGLSIRMSKFKLVGIAWLDLPESASIMLEDSESGQTHFLKEGDKIEDVTVMTIYVDRVVFSYQNEEIVFKL